MGMGQDEVRLGPRGGHFPWPFSREGQTMISS